MVHVRSLHPSVVEADVWDVLERFGKIVNVFMMNRKHQGISCGRTMKDNRSPKGNMWSAIPVALICLIRNCSEGKQGSGPSGDNVL